MTRNIPRLDKSMGGLLDAGVFASSEGRLIAQQFLKERYAE